MTKKSRLSLSLTALLLSSAHSFKFQQHARRSANVVLSASSPSNSKTTDSDAFVASFFSSSDCDDSNMPPSLSTLLQSISKLQSGSDIRGQFIDHARVGSIANVAHRITTNTLPALTPMAAHCFGYAFATMLRETRSTVKIGLGTDPRPHGPRLSDAFARGAQSVPGVQVLYTGIATTPAMLEFCRSDFCDGGVMATASHLPVDRNGFKLFTKNDGGFSKSDIARLVELAALQAQYWHDTGIIPPTSGAGAVFCTEWVDWMPHYAKTLTDAIVREVGTNSHAPLAGLKIVLNAGHGSGGFFNKVLQELGADMSASVHIEPNGDFPVYIPNPESKNMVDETTQICEASNADIGIMLDTDADRCGFVVPRSTTADGQNSNYEPLHRNRLIALLGVIFSQAAPGCTVVTDSVTSEGLATFLQDDLGLQHVRYLKGYANVIGKARELTEAGIANAELAIETSGHCAMKENGYLDDGTYTAVKVIGLLARSKNDRTSLLNLIAGLKEMPETQELRMDVTDQSLETTVTVFDAASLALEQFCITESTWSLDRDNLEGVRVRIGNGGFFMLRKSLHDPLISLQLEGTSREEIRNVVIKPLLQLLRNDPVVSQGLSLAVLETY